MATEDPLLDRELISEAFRRLGDRLARRGLVADVYAFAGAAMAHAYDARRGDPGHSRSIRTTRRGPVCTMATRGRSATWSLAWPSARLRYCARGAGW
jgi:hypothetical protein